MGYLAQSEVEWLKAEQAKYDPKKVSKEREWFSKKHPEFTPEDLNLRFASPNENVLRGHKIFANKVVEVLTISVSSKDKHKAFATILTQENVTIKGEFYPHGKANVELVGEGNYWKVKDHNDSHWRFK